MRYRSEAIVLGLRPYTDRWSLLQLYSRQEGVLRLQVYGAHSKRRSHVLYQPLSVVEVDFERPLSSDLGRLVSLDATYLPQGIYDDIRKQTIAIFVAEVLSLALIHPLQDLALYEYLTTFISELEDTQQPEDMHVLLLMHLAGALGIGLPPMAFFPKLAQDEDTLLEKVLQQRLLRAERRYVLERLCDYYAEQLDYFRRPKSLDVLTEVFA